MDGYPIRISSKSKVSNLNPLAERRPPISCGVVNGEILEDIPLKIEYIKCLFLA